MDNPLCDQELIAQAEARKKKRQRERYQKMLQGREEAYIRNLPKYAALAVPIASLMKANDYLAVRITAHQVRSLCKVKAISKFFLMGLYRYFKEHHELSFTRESTYEGGVYIVVYDSLAENVKNAELGVPEPKAEDTEIPAP